MLENQAADRSPALPIAASQIIAEAALLCVPFTALAYQAVRMDGYDTEKMGLLGIFVAVIVGAQIPALLRNIRRWRQVFDSPIQAVVLAVLGVALISTATSLSPSLSFWGEPSRSQGLLTALMYAVLFFQAAQLRRSTRAVLVPSLLLAAIPACLWSIILFAQGTDRLLLGSTAGNPNFLSSWIVMVLLYCLPQLYRRITRWPRPLTSRRWLMLAFYAVPVAIMLICLLTNASRGALLGLGVGGLFYVVTAAATARNRRLLLTIGAVIFIVAVGGAAAVWIKANVQGQAATGDSPLSRLFVPYDPVRLAIWDAAATVVSLQTQPVFTINRQPDALAQLRPLVGYGPETVEQLQSRYGDIFGPDVAVNSFHNTIFDALITQGWLGLLAMLALLECAMYGGLRWLGLLDRSLIGQWIVWQVAGAISGIIVLTLLIPQSSPSSLTPLGAAFGAVAGLLLWIGQQGFSRRPALPLLSNDDMTLVAAILAALIAQWVDNQLGFAQGTTLPLQWILLGLLAATIAEPSSHEESPPESPYSWATAALIAGLFTAFSFGVMLQSQLAQVEAGSDQLPILLTAVLGTGIAGTVLHIDPASRRYRRLIVGAVVMVLIVAGFIAIKAYFVTVASGRLDAAIAQSDGVTRALGQAVPLLSISGIVLALSAVILMASQNRISALNKGMPGAMTLASAFCIVILAGVACFVYSAHYTSGVLHNIGNALAERAPVIPGSPELTLATAALAAASEITPSNAALRLHWAAAVGVRLNVEPDPAEAAALRAEFGRLLADVFQEQPYFVNTLEWRNFSRNFANLLK